MTQKYQFRAVIKNAGDGGAYVVVPLDVENTFGQKRLKVKATIDGEPYRGTLVRMGGPQHILLMLKEIRQRIGKSYGDEVSIEFQEDLDPQILNIPPDLQQALDAEPEAYAYFEQLSYSHKKEYIRWITDAIRDQTRQKRIQQTIDMLKQGKNEH